MLPYYQIRIYSIQTNLQLPFRKICHIYCIIKNKTLFDMIIEKKMLCRVKWLFFIVFIDRLHQNQSFPKRQEETLLSSIIKIIYCSVVFFNNSAVRMSTCIFSSATIFSLGTSEKGTEY